MKPQILLKAYIQYQSEEAFRDLVATSVDNVYSIALQIVKGAPHLAEETVSRVYCELARKAPGLGEEVVLASWLREHTCRLAVKVMHEENRSVDRAVLKKQRQALDTAEAIEAAPTGLAIRVSQGVLLNTRRHKGFWFLLPRAWCPVWVRPVHMGVGVVCVLAIVGLGKIPFHKSNPIVRSQELRMTPSSFAQMAEERGDSLLPNTNVQIKGDQP